MTDASTLQTDDRASGATPPRTVAVCIAAFNRREKTLACLESLAAQALPPGLRLEIYLLDDASTDGTPEAVRERYPHVHLFGSEGDLWWAGGMRVAYGAALERGHDFYIWMNDDVVAKRDAVARLVATHDELHERLGGSHMISGAMLDPQTKQPSYGGFRLKNRRFPQPFRMVLPSPDEPLPCDLMNANMLLFPRELADQLGNIPDVYQHTLGDWDYGLSARKRGAGLWLAPGYVGFCAANVSNRLRWGGSGLTLMQRYRQMQHPLALPLRSRAAFLLRHFPWTAPIYIPGPYLKLPFDHFRWKRREKRS
jgi:GT2 family glycosyltransferase